MNRWEPAANDRIRCTVHDVVFTKLEECRGCIAEPDTSDLHNADEPVVTPKGCASLEDHERHFMQLAKFAEDLARKVVKPVPKPRKRKEPTVFVMRGKKLKPQDDAVEPEPKYGRINYATACMLLDVAIKATRAAAEHTATRERRAHVKRLERYRIALRAGQGKRN